MCVLFLSILKFIVRFSFSLFQISLLSSTHFFCIPTSYLFPLKISCLQILLLWRSKAFYIVGIGIEDMKMRWLEREKGKCRLVRIRAENPYTFFLKRLSLLRFINRKLNYGIKMALKMGDGFISILETGLSANLWTTIIWFVWTCEFVCSPCSLTNILLVSCRCIIVIGWNGKRENKNGEKKSWNYSKMGGFVYFVEELKKKWVNTIDLQFYTSYNCIFISSVDCFYFFFVSSSSFLVFCYVQLAANLTG